MSATLAGFPYLELRFDAEGAADRETDALVAELAQTGARDLFVISHGWNNAPDKARRLYERFFDLVGAQLPARAGVAVTGVIWPAMRWPDEGDPEAGTGGAASLAGTRLDDEAIVASLRDVFPNRDELLGELGALLAERPDDPAQLDRFHRLVAQLATDPDDADDAEDNHERSLFEQPARVVFTRSARQAATSSPGAATAIDGGGAAIEDVGGAASFGDLDRLWDGAKHVLRQTTYWEMKKRAGRVGARGLGPLIAALHVTAPDMRIHLIGHSFGARVISFALQGMGDFPANESPVKSAFLVQGAFSHYAFAASLPHDPQRSGALAGLQCRVDGPIVVTHSKHDLAVGRMYPAASIARGQDAAKLSEWMLRWAAIGHDGAQAVGARKAPLGEPGTTYDLRAGQFLNLDADDVIRHGKWPSGAHSDIFHPELAWAALAAAALAPAAASGVTPV